MNSTRFSTRRSGKSVEIASTIIDHLRTNPKGVVAVIKPGGKTVVLKNRKVR